MRRLCTPAWIMRHVLTVALVGAFLALGWWQLSRATSGNTLSWAYALEWPIFAGFVVFLWVREARHTLGRDGAGPEPRVAGLEPGPALGSAPAGRTLAGTATATESSRPAAGIPGGDAPRPGFRSPVRSTRVRQAAALDTEIDRDLAAYNHYLAWLTANPGARPGDYPGPDRPRPDRPAPPPDAPAGVGTRPTGGER